MDLEVSEETLRGTTRCPFDFACLRDPGVQVCPVQRVIAGDGVFVESKREETCPYVVSFGYGHVCTCATRVELHERYGVQPETPLVSSDFSNVYDDERRAESYARLEFPGTYYLAYRDLPAVFAEHVRGIRAMDFGCGTGRSTRFLRGLGYRVVGVDIARHMLARAREEDPHGDYRLVSDDGLGEFASGAYDLILSAFTFDNIPTAEKKVRLFKELARLLSDGGRIVSVVSSPDIYVNEWASFSTKDFPGNRSARSGDKVFIVMLDVEDGRPVEDVVWSHEDYERVYEEAGLESIEMRKPLGMGGDPCAWVSETVVAPWVIYVLGRTA